MSDSENENQEDGEVKDVAELTKELEDKCQEAFNALDNSDSGYIASGDIKKMLEIMGIKEDEDEVFRLLSDIDPDNSGQVAYHDVKSRIVNREIARLGDNDDSELLDAYVSMGGDPDGGGCVDAAKLISTIKEEFQMTIDIEKLIEEIDEDGSGEIEFDEFKALLAGDTGDS